MRTRYLFLALLAALVLAAVSPGSAAAASPSPPNQTLAWQRLIGGQNGDVGETILSATGGGYLLFGSSTSSRSMNLTPINHGETPTGTYTLDIWVVKVDDAGEILWQQLLGGSGDEVGRSLRATPDGGYIFTGYSRSSESGDVTGTNHGDWDVWVVKLTATGGIEWQRLLGGAGTDAGVSIAPTGDGGYILAANTESSRSGDVAGTNHGTETPDIWVVKLGAQGEIGWQQLLGGADIEQACWIGSAGDGGFVLYGYSYSSVSGDVLDANHGASDLWIAKLDAGGVPRAQRLLGGAGTELSESLVLPSAGGCLVVGTSSSSQSGDVTGINHGPTYSGPSYGDDIWVVRLDGAFGIQWQQLLGGSGLDEGDRILEVAGGGYVLLGSTYASRSGDVTGTSHGGRDIWVAGLDGTGVPRWQRLLGGSGTDFAEDIAPVPGGGYLLLGTVNSFYSGDVTGYGITGFNYWLARLAPAILPIPPSMLVPTDTNADGLYDDVNGNGRKDFADVVLYFNQMSWIAANEPVGGFDYNGNTRIDFADVVWLFNNI